MHISLYLLVWKMLSYSTSFDLTNFSRSHHIKTRFEYAYSGRQYRQHPTVKHIERTDWPDQCLTGEAAEGVGYYDPCLPREDKIHISELPFNILSLYGRECFQWDLNSGTLHPGKCIRDTTSRTLHPGHHIRDTTSEWQIDSPSGSGPTITFLFI